MPTEPAACRQHPFDPYPFLEKRGAHCARHAHAVSRSTYTRRTKNLPPMTDACIVHTVAGSGDERPQNPSWAISWPARAGESARSPRTHGIPTFALKAHDRTTSDRIARVPTGRGTEAGGGDPSPEHPERRRSGDGGVGRGRHRFAALTVEASQRPHFGASVRRHLCCTMRVSGHFRATRANPQDRQRRARRSVRVGCVRAAADPFR